MILGVEDILISWFVIILALLGIASLFVCCMIHCKHLRLSDANKLSYLLTYCMPLFCRCDLSQHVRHAVLIVAAVAYLSAVWSDQILNGISLQLASCE